MRDIKRFRMLVIGGPLPYHGYEIAAEGARKCGTQNLLSPSAGNRRMGPHSDPRLLARGDGPNGHWRSGGEPWVPVRGRGALVRGGSAGGWQGPGSLSTSRSRSGREGIRRTRYRPPIGL